MLKKEEEEKKVPAITKLKYSFVEFSCDTRHSSVQSQKKFSTEGDLFTPVFFPLPFVLNIQQQQKIIKVLILNFSLCTSNLI